MFFIKKDLYVWCKDMRVIFKLLDESLRTYFLCYKYRNVVPYIYGAKELETKALGAEGSKRDSSAVIWKVSGLLNQNYQGLLAEAILTLDNRIFSKYVVTVLKTVVNKWRQIQHLSLCLHAFLSIAATKRYTTSSSYNHS